MANWSRELMPKPISRLSHNPAALVVPLQAIDHQGDQTSVMVVDPDNRIQIKQVTLGIQMPDYVDIASGLAAGQQVVVSDRSGLKAGQTVKPKPLQSVPYEGSAQAVNRYGGLFDS